MDYSEFVHEYTSADGKTRYVVAQRVYNRYIAPMNERGHRLTGASCLVGRRAEDVAGSTTYTYARKRDAIRRARDLYGYADED